MDSFSKRLKELRESKGWTQDELANKLGVSRPAVAGYESEEKNRIPRKETLSKIADLFGVTTDYLLGRVDFVKEGEEPYYALSEKDEKDIAKRLEKIMNDLESDASLAYHGEPMDEETRRLVSIAIENSMRMAREIAKKKFTPKKYRNNNEE